jgi:hypothetical protein
MPPHHRFLIFLPKSTSCKSSHINPPVCPHGVSLVESIGLESASYGTALDAAHEGRSDFYSGPVTCAQCSSSSAIESWRALFGTWDRDR